MLAPLAYPVVKGGLAAWQVRMLTDYIESNISATHSRPELAQRVRLSPGHFGRAFRRSFGMSPEDFVMCHRVLRAKALLETSQVSLAEIALDCGLLDTSRLRRAFRRFVGVTPTAWRLMARRENEGKSGPPRAPVEA